jgi:hypothetical protein
MEKVKIESSVNAARQNTPQMLKFLMTKKSHWFVIDMRSSLLIAERTDYLPGRQQRDHVEYLQGLPIHNVDAEEDALA